MRPRCALRTSYPAVTLARLTRGACLILGERGLGRRADRTITERNAPPVSPAAGHADSMARNRTCVRRCQGDARGEVEVTPTYGGACIFDLCMTALRSLMTESGHLRVGGELRRIREQAGLSGSAVARDLGWSQSKVSRVETGRFGASLEEVAELLNYYGVAEEVRAELLASVARHEGMEGAWVVRSGGTKRRQAELATVESRVKGLSQYQALWFPGLLQSADYAAAVAASGRFGPQGAFVERRLERQAVLNKQKGVKYRAVIEEHALTVSPGAGFILPSQLEHVLEAVETGFVDLRIRLRTAENAVFTAGSFVLYDFKSGPPVVLAEAQTADLYLSAEADVTAYQELFSELQRDALDAQASRELVESARRRGAP